MAGTAQYRSSSATFPRERRPRFALAPNPDQAPLDDALIAAIADARQMTVVTPNTKHFEPLGVRCVNPWNPHS